MSWLSLNSFIKIHGNCFKFWVCVLGKGFVPQLPFCCCTKNCFGPCAEWKETLSGAHCCQASTLMESSPEAVGLQLYFYKLHWRRHIATVSSRWFVSASITCSFPALYLFLCKSGMYTHFPSPLSDFILLKEATFLPSNHIQQHFLACIWR